MGSNSGETMRLLGLRFRDSLAAWIQANAEDSGRTMSAVVREALEDARSMYGLPSPVVELLEEDAAVLGTWTAGAMRSTCCFAASSRSSATGPASTFRRCERNRSSRTVIRMYIVQ